MGEKGNAGSASGAGAGNQHAPSALDGPAPSTARAGSTGEAKRSSPLQAPAAEAQRTPGDGVHPGMSTPSSAPSPTLPPIVAIGGDDDDRGEPNS